MNEDLQGSGVVKSGCLGAYSDYCCSCDSKTAGDRISVEGFHVLRRVRDEAIQRGAGILFL
eukprot:scaffold250270_cov15-Tisochrysis_lutea.AAC.1